MDGRVTKGIDSIAPTVARRLHVSRTMRHRSLAFPALALLLASAAHGQTECYRHALGMNPRTTAPRRDYGV